MTETRMASSIATLGMLAALGGCSRESCRNEATIGLPSPDGARIAYVFHRTCTGSPITTHVSVIALPNSLRNETGNVLTVAGDQPVHIAWRTRSPHRTRYGRLSVSSTRPPAQAPCRKESSGTVSATTEAMLPDSTSNVGGIALRPRR